MPQGNGRRPLQPTLPVQLHTQPLQLHTQPLHLHTLPAQVQTHAQHVNTALMQLPLGPQNIRHNAATAFAGVRIAQNNYAEATTPQQALAGLHNIGNSLQTYHTAATQAETWNHEAAQRIEANLRQMYPRATDEQIQNALQRNPAYQAHQNAAMQWNALAENTQTTGNRLRAVTQQQVDAAVNTRVTVAVNPQNGAVTFTPDPNGTNPQSQRLGDIMNLNAESRVATLGYLLSDLSQQNPQLIPPQAQPRRPQQGAHLQNPNMQQALQQAQVALNDQPVLSNPQHLDLNHNRERHHGIQEGGFNPATRTVT